jgi:hypothetical protein
MTGVMSDDTPVERVLLAMIERLAGIVEWVARIPLNFEATIRLLVKRITHQL